METIGEKIAEIRKRKGLTQEELSDKALINLRTLQRIEKGETEPRGHTLRVLCEELDVNIEDILDYGKKEDKRFLIYFHLSVIFGVVIPFGDIIVPAILWLTNRDRIISLNEQGVNVLNFRICWVILIFATGVLLMLAKLQHFPVAGIGSMTGIVLLCATNILVTVLYPVFVAISIYKRKTLRMYYPAGIKIIR